MRRTLPSVHDALRTVCRTCLGVAILVAAAGGGEQPPQDGRENLARGRTVLFAPAPNYQLTAKGDTDPTDLTDGKLSERDDRRMWFESLAVGWSYGGRVNLAVDLGRMVRIDEIAIRLIGGSPSAGVSFPGWIEAMVSRDGEHYVKVAECSRWREGDFDQFGVPDDAGEAWIHCLRFPKLKVAARWVGLRFYASGLTVSDELYVFGSPDKNVETSPLAGEPSGFTVSHPQPYFHKPELVVPIEVSAPQPLGVVLPKGWRDRATLHMTLDLPPGIVLRAGLNEPEQQEGVSSESLPDGATRYRFEAAPGASGKTFKRLYLQAPEWKDGQKAALRYQFGHGGWESPVETLPLRAAAVPPAPRLRRIMAGLGWWSASATAAWPDALDAWRRLGLNSFPMFAQWMPEGNSIWKLVEEARRRGFFLVNIDSPLHRMMQRAAREKEIYDQFADGSAGRQMCLSYRGPFYRREMERFGKVMGRARPDFASLDIEIWGWRGPVDSRMCVRCQKDFAASGLKDWDEWRIAKGVEIWSDMMAAAHAEIEKAGGGPHCDIGGYDFRPGQAYQNVWSVDRLYPDKIQVSQVSTYTCLYPYHLELIGDEVRQDRSRLPRSDVMPWITPGDAGTFPGEALQWALLECYANGARGVYFWSGRVWDAESLLAYNRVVRAIAPVEDLILEGELVGDAAAVVGTGRVSGIRRGNEMLLLVADYFRRGDGSVKCKLAVGAPSELRDVLAGSTVAARLAPGEQTIEIPLEGARARLLRLRPAD